MYQSWSCKVTTIQRGNGWFFMVCHIGNGLGGSSGTLKYMVHNHLPQQYKFLKNEVDIDISDDGSKLLTAIHGIYSHIKSY